MVVLEPGQVPDLSGKRILISSGAHDPIVPDDHPGRLAKTFRSAGAKVTAQVHVASHGLVPGDLAAAADFLRQG